MKKTLIGISAALLLAAPIAFVAAESTTTTTTTREQKREEMKARWEERREALEQKREEIKNRFEEKRAEFSADRQQKIANILERVITRLQSAIDRLTGFADRIDARLTLLEDEGLDMDVPQGHVDAARDTLDDAQEKLNGIDPSEILEDLGTTTPPTAIGTLRAELVAVKELLREAHGQLIDAISSIKAGLQRNDDDEDEDEDDE
ncbi:MAG: hypothetical protein AMXMBFR44_2300 [Candidatus Campbellbacteria bacterium]